MLWKASEEIKKQFCYGPGVKSVNTILELFMRLHSLGNSELQVPPIIFGCWAIGGWCWGGTDDRLATKAIHASIDSGINAFDTAPIYGFGHSETILGKALLGKRHTTIVMTKTGRRTANFSTRR